MKKEEKDVHHISAIWTKCKKKNKKKKGFSTIITVIHLCILLN